MVRYLETLLHEYKQLIRAMYLSRVINREQVLAIRRRLLAIADELGREVGQTNSEKRQAELSTLTIGPR